MGERGSLKAFCRLLFAAVVALSSCNPSSGVWKAEMARCEKDTAITSLVFVKCTSGSNAIVEYYRRDSLGRFRLCREEEGFIGRGGLGKEREGDGCTPEGDFGAVTAFGILPDPGTVLPYIDVRESTFACDEEGPYYNTIIDTVATEHRCGGEDMLHCAPMYNYGIALDFNSERIYPLGSAIFFHCKGSNPWTGGCVAVDEPFMVEILSTCGANPRFCIHGI